MLIFCYVDTKMSHQSKRILTMLINESKFLKFKSKETKLMNIKAWRLNSKYTKSTKTSSKL